MCGFVNPDSGKFIYSFIEKGNSINFIEALKHLCNNEIDASTSGKGITLILDNIKFHKTKIVTDFALQNNINIIYLPPYSPDYNPIERLWYIVRLKRLRNKSFDSINHLKNEFIDFFKKAKRIKIKKYCKIKYE